MILRSVVARAYGALRDAELAGLSGGLNVVFGKNEAGKTTYTSLVRDVLYGFPSSGKAKERYTPSGGGDKSGALLFADDGGEWRIERTHTSSPSGRGAVVVEMGGSAPRPGLVAELTHGVGEDMFRDVLGFGLDELAAVGGLTDEGLRSRLFTAGAGLGRVDISKIRAELVKSERAEVGARGGGGARADTAASELKRVEEEIAEVHRAQESLEVERAQLDGVDSRLDGLEADRLAADARLGSLEALSGRLSMLTTARRQRVERLEDSQRRLESVQAQLEGLAPSEEVLSAAGAIQGLRDDLAVFEREAANARELGAEAAAARSEASRLAAALGQGWTADRCAAVPTGIGVEDGVEEHRDRLRRAALRTEQAEDDAARASVELDAADRTVAAGASGGRASLGPAAVAGAVAVIAAAVSVALQQWAVLGVAALVGVLAVYLAVVARRAPGTQASPDTAGAEAKVAAAEQAVRESRAAEATLREEWRAWCVEQGLPDDVDDPQTMARLLRACSDVAARSVAAEDASERASSSQETVDAFVVRLGELDIPGARLPDGASPEAAAQLARDLIERLESAQEVEAARRSLEKDRDGIVSEIERTNAEDATDSAAESEQRAEIALLLEQAGLPPEFAEAGLDAIVARAREIAAEVRGAQEAAMVERTELVERLRQAEQTERTEGLRQERELHARELADAVERYVVYRLAQRLLDEAQHRYEAERQPGVVRRAAELFREITDGRYVDVVARVGEEDVQVVEAGGARKSPDELSRGAKEQLYLSVRLAFIDELRGTGCDLPLIIDDAMGNFDDERMANVAVALANVAESRQVIVFTCHDSTVAAFEAAAPGCNLVTLERR